MKKKFHSMMFLIVLAMFVFLNIPVSLAARFPDLKIADTSLSGGETIDEGFIEFNVSVKNTGADTSQKFIVAVEVDGNPVDDEEIDGLRGNTIKNLSFILRLRPGDHLIRIIADYDNRVCEENEQNNEKIILVHVREIKPDIAVKEVKDIPSMLIDGDRIVFNLTIENKGHDLTQPFIIEIKAGKSKKTLEISDPLYCGESLELSINFTPIGLGKDKIVIVLDSENEVEESNESNNLWEKNVTIYKFLPWYDKTLHYRVLVKTYGEGIAEIEINERDILEQLGLAECNIDENSLIIVEYTYSGIKNDSVIQCINLSDDNLIRLRWLAEDGYYMIYFDTLENGEKEKIICDEIQGETDVDVEILFPPEAWRIDVGGIINNSIVAKNSTYKISVKSTAELNEVEIKIQRDESIVENLLADYINSTAFEKRYTFSEVGNYIVRIIASDMAGYRVSKNISVKVREADVSISDISLSENIYAKTPSYAMLKVDSNVLLEMVYARVLIVYNDNATSEFKHEITMDNYSKEISLEFTAEKTGNATMNVEIFLPDEIPEKDPSDNVISVEIHVENLPDIRVLDIFATSNSSENGPVTIYALVKNPENMDIECRAYLFVARNSLDWSPSNAIFSKRISLPLHSVVNISLIWEKPQGGKWLVGVEIECVEILDANVMNNRMTRIISVREGDRKPPTITNVSIDVGSGEVGCCVRITANISDENGIKEANIHLIYPDGHEEVLPMFPVNDSLYAGTCRVMKQGYYMCYIEAIDDSYIANTANSNTFHFEITNDYSPPLIKSVFILPDKKQLVGRTLTIGCALEDNTGLKSVNITIVEPDGMIINDIMEESNGIFLYNRSFTEVGKYSFFVSSEDLNGNKNFSDVFTFWITEDLNDIDSDGIPDWWEKIYGLDPENPDDANGDMDGDGFTEIKEYMNGLNPNVQNTIAGFSQHEIFVILLIGLTLLPLMVVIIFSGRKD